MVTFFVVVCSSFLHCCIVFFFHDVVTNFDSMGFPPFLHCLLFGVILQTHLIIESLPIIRPCGDLFFFCKCFILGDVFEVKNSPPKDFNWPPGLFFSF